MLRTELILNKAHIKGKLAILGGFSLQTGSRSVHICTDDALGTELLDGLHTGTNHGVHMDSLCLDALCMHLLRLRCLHAN